ncbi:hypothetical protein MEA186_24822 [Mesorhizobium amorphae CCNWGS0123]|uniref:Uncharacterized protein n=1 Tax=Mesorhizobium amorphae CCNWGS0123 TaxID=1082933 RepID=G6YG58_9HYPH|nr:hypothetical protein MEA186_24822 [Mesorhizobium amorphae CCNWGS0123]
MAVCIERSPQPVFPALDGNDHLIKVPFVGQGALDIRWIWRVYAAPNLPAHSPTVWKETVMPRTASIRHGEG